MFFNNHFSFINQSIQDKYRPTSDRIGIVRYCTRFILMPDIHERQFNFCEIQCLRMRVQIKENEEN